MALVLAFVPGVALASTTASTATPSASTPSLQAAPLASEEAQLTSGTTSSFGSNNLVSACMANAVASLGEGAQQAQAEAQRVNKTLAYDRALIDRIGTQESTGHTICCPSFSCAYADAVMDGTVHDHDYYVCSNCLWTDWGGANSAYRSVGSDEQLLREAYDQIAAGRPTVIHVAASYGEHWIALIGYQNATDPDHLTLANFVALDPWNGAQVIASDSFTLYGDGCEHISDR